MGSLLCETNAVRKGLVKRSYLREFLTAKDRSISERNKQRDYSMKRFRMTAAILGLLSAYFAPSVRADDQNKETHLTTNVPIRVQDTLLAPGQYVFKLIELGANSDVVSIFNSNGT